MVVEEYILENLCCANCAAKIETQVRNLDGIDEVQLDFMRKTLRIYTSKETQTYDKIHKIVKSIEPDVKVITKTALQSEQKIALPIGLISVGIAVIIAIIASFAPIPAQTNILLYISAYLFSSWKVLYKSAIRIIRMDFLDEHFLMSIASLGALYLGEYTEAIAVMVLYEIGQYFENKAINNSRKSIQSLLSLKPDRVHLLRNGKIEEILLAEIRVNDLIVINPGERIPLDGVISQGQSTLDTSALTGEAMPMNVDENASVISGALNLTGKLTVKVTSTDADSTVTRILKLVETANQRKSQTENFITRFARKYTPAVVFISIFIALIMPVVTGQPFEMWLERALIFLIVSCPCALVISVPLTNYAAIGAAARRGILFKGSNFIDALARLKTIVYDKTGTLTTGRLSVREIYTNPDVPESELIKAALTCEGNSSHPLAVAVKNAWSASNPVTAPLLINEYHGKGIKAQTTETVYYTGNRLFMVEMEVRNIPAEPVETCIFVAAGIECLGYITFRDEIKTGFADVIKKLKHQGVRNHLMLTGDHAFQAQKVADELGLNHFDARLLPDEKVMRMETIEKTYPKPTAFVGDGLNDAPVLAGAEIGIAMGGIGNQAAIEAADVILMQDEPQQLLTAVLMARKTKSILWQNIGFALGIKVIIMILGTTGHANLWEAVIADVGVTLLAVGNAMRLLKK
jgi:Cd2+/Zn2+-exporting ATPase